jgi:hypothetical protein
MIIKSTVPTLRSQSARLSTSLPYDSMGGVAYEEFGGPHAPQGGDRSRCTKALEKIACQKALDCEQVPFGLHIEGV